MDDDFAAQQCVELREALGCGPDELVGSSAAHAAMLLEIRLVARRNVRVLLTGPSGVGKTATAAVLHRASGRRGAFVSVNASELVPSLAESQLFGHERGSFTGAETRARGLVAEADGGTLFIDEIADLEPSVQAKLLTFLDSGQYRGIGLSEARADVRLVTATNRELASLRSELLARIAQFEIPVPPLAERPGDIPAIAEVLLLRIAQREWEPLIAMRLSPSAEAALLAKTWPMNVRELESVLRKGDIRARAAGTRRICAEHLFPEQDIAELGNGPWEERFGLFRRLIVEDALRACGGHFEKAARLLGISRSSLYAWASAISGRREAG